MRNGFWGGGWFPLMSWQEEILKRGRRSLQMPYGYFKRFFKRNVPSEKHMVLSPHKKEKPPRPKSSLG